MKNCLNLTRFKFSEWFIIRGYLRPRGTIHHFHVLFMCRLISQFHFIVYNFMWLNWIEKRSNWPRINHVMVSSMSDWPQITHLKRWNVEERRICRSERSGINKHSCKLNHYYCYVKIDLLRLSFILNFKTCIISDVCGSALPSRILLGTLHNYHYY